MGAPGLEATDERTRIKLSFLEMLESSLSMEERLGRLAQLLVPSVADFCTVEVGGWNGLPKTVAIVAADPRKEPVLRRLRELYSRPAEEGEGIARAIEAAEPVLIRDMSPAILEDYARSSGPHEPEVRDALTRLGTRSAMAIPLRVGGAPPFGAVAVNTAESGRRFDESDLMFVRELAAIGSLAIDNARLFNLEHAARVDAERARDRTAFLAEAGFLLDSAIGLEERLARLARLAVPRIADWCVVELAEIGQPRTVAIEHADPATRELARELQRRYPTRPDQPYGPSAVMRSGRAQLVERITEEMIEESAQDDEHLRAIRQLGPRSFVCMPLAARGVLFGTLTLMTAESERSFDSDDLAYFQILAARASVALDNARAFDRQRRMNETLQEVLLPPELPDVPNLEIAACFRPAGGDVDVGGDFYDAFTIDESTVIVVVGDVCGKGVEAATLTVLARFALRATARLEADPGRLLQMLNTTVLEQHTTNRFITLALARVEMGDRSARVTFARAGHPLPLILRTSGQVEPISPGGPPVGIGERLEVDPTTVDLGAGDAFVLYTDGLTESRRDHVLFGRDRVEAILSACAGTDAASIVDSIASEETGFRRGDPPRDDMAILSVRIPD